MGQLESLQAIARLGFLAHDVQNGVNELGALCVMSLGPVVAGARLAEHEVVWSEDLAEGTGSHGVHCAGFEIDENGARNVLAAGCLIVVNVDALQLEIAVAVVGAGSVDAMLVADDFPELDTTIKKNYANLIICSFENPFHFPFRHSKINSLTSVSTRLRSFIREILSHSERNFHAHTHTKYTRYSAAQ